MLTLPTVAEARESGSSSCLVSLTFVRVFCLSGSALPFMARRGIFCGEALLGLAVAE